MSSNGVIGLNGKLPWPSIPEDFKFFREKTLGKTIILGRTTFESLPFLKDRQIIVLSSKTPVNDRYDMRQVEVTSDIDNLPSDSVVCGGAKVYESLLPYCDKLYITHVMGIFEGDTLFPKYDHLFEIDKILQEGVSEKSGIDYLIGEFKRI